MRVVIGKKVVEMNAVELHRRLEGKSGLMLDIGTGDGRFAYRWARDHPETLCVGLDPVAEAMREMSHKAARKPSRGGLDNALFVHAAIDRPPEELAALADRIFVNYPWGSLLEGIVRPDAATLARIVGFGRRPAHLTILLNYSVFDDPDYLARLGLPPFDLEAVHSRLAPALERLDTRVIEAGIDTGDLPYPTSWQRRLVAGSGRKALRIEARLGPA